MELEVSLNQQSSKIIFEGSRNLIVELNYEVPKLEVSRDDEVPMSVDRSTHDVRVQNLLPFTSLIYSLFLKYV